MVFVKEPDFITFANQFLSTLTRVLNIP